MKRYEQLLYLILLLALLLAAAYMVQTHTQKTNDLQQQLRDRDTTIAEQDNRIFVLESENYSLADMLEQERAVIRQMENWLDTWEIVEMDISGYAPLDPDAVEGMCYEGDPDVTFSGEPPIPGETAAGHISRMGQAVFIPYVGWRRINDIGGMIGEYDLDLCFDSRREALIWGRKQMQAVTLR